MRPFKVRVFTALLPTLAACTEVAFTAEPSCVDALGAPIAERCAEPRIRPSACSDVVVSRGRFEVVDFRTDAPLVPLPSDLTGRVFGDASGADREWGNGTPFSVAPEGDAVVLESPVSGPFAYEIVRIVGPPRYLRGLRHHSARATLDFLPSSELDERCAAEDEVCLMGRVETCGDETRENVMVRVVVADGREDTFVPTWMGRGVSPGAPEIVRYEPGYATDGTGAFLARGRLPGLDVDELVSLRVEAWVVSGASGEPAPQRVACELVNVFAGDASVLRLRPNATGDCR